jgi:hypothetical protein
MGEADGRLSVLSAIVDRAQRRSHGDQEQPDRDVCGGHAGGQPKATAAEGPAPDRHQRNREQLSDRR